MKLAQACGTQLTLSDIERSNRVRPRHTRSSSTSRPNVIIVKFVSYRSRSSFVRGKESVDYRGIFIYGDLTHQRADLLRNARFLVKNKSLVLGHLMAVSSSSIMMAVSSSSIQMAVPSSSIMMAVSSSSIQMVVSSSSIQMVVSSSSIQMVVSSSSIQMAVSSSSIMMAVSSSSIQMVVSSSSLQMAVSSSSIQMVVSSSSIQMAVSSSSIQMAVSSSSIQMAVSSSSIQMVQGVCLLLRMISPILTIELNTQIITHGYLNHLSTIVIK